MNSRKTSWSFGALLFWVLAAVGSGAWVVAIGLQLHSKVASKLGARSLQSLDLQVVQSLALKNIGLVTLLISVSLLALVALSCVGRLLRKTTRAHGVNPHLAPTLLVSASLLRAIELIYQGWLRPTDIDMLAVLTAASALMYFGSSRLWWAVLMPLGTAASLLPLAWLEYFKGASESLLTRAALGPAAAFLFGSCIIVLRELDRRSRQSVLDLRSVHARGLQIKKQMHALEAELKTLTASTPTAADSISSVAKVRQESEADSDSDSEASETMTTEFSTIDYSKAALTTGDVSSYQDVDAATRKALEDIKLPAQVRLLLTAPVSTGLPLAVRANQAALGQSVKALVLNSIDSLGGFPNGFVRITLRPGLTALAVSVEDNGRGMSSDMRTKLGVSQEDRMTLEQIRKDVEASGGRFDIQARLGVGTRISIELVRVDALGIEQTSQSPRNNREMAKFAVNPKSPTARSVDLH